MEYLPRIIDRELDDLMAELPALALEGARGVGKTATASRRAATLFELDDPGQREVIAAEPELIGTVPTPVLLDEWQRHPPLWDYVRRQVDRAASPGTFLLTGSAAPAEAPAHSGAGRIVSLRMRPLSLAERAISSPTVGLGALLSGERPPIAGQTDLALHDYVREILASGFPGLRGLSPRARRAQMEGYLDRIVSRAFPELGWRVRRPAALRAWLTAYAAATATTASYNVLLNAATPQEGSKPSRSTTEQYREVLSQLWLLDPVPGWLPTGNRLRRLTQAPKHHLVDPALAAHLLGVTESTLLRGQDGGGQVPRDGTLLGALFESLVTLSIRVYAQANETRVHHLRTRDSEHEIDLILERGDRVIGLEVKLQGNPGPEDVRHLRWLQEQLGDDLVDSAVITAGAFAYRRRDGIAVVPAALLGP